MLKKILNMLSVVFIVLIIISHAAAANKDDDLASFVNLLSKEVTPTLADYYYYYGIGNELELELVLNECDKKGWKPVLKHPKCTEFIDKRETNKSWTPSLFFKWLKSKLPASPKLSDIRVKHERGKTIIEHDLISASLDGVNVLFYRTVGLQTNIDQFGVIGISRINGVPVEKLLKDDLAKAKQ